MKIGLRRPGLRNALLSLNCDPPRIYVLAALIVLLCLPEVGGEALRNALRYERAGIARGEIWRFVTAHVVHLDVAHALLNAAGLALMWMLFARDFAASRWLVIIVVSVAAIDAGLWFFDTDVRWYVGASGVLHGVMAAGTLAHVRRREWDAWILLAFLVGKLLYEQTQGALPLSSSELRVVVDAHLYGALGGAVAATAAGLARKPL